MVRNLMSNAEWAFLNNLYCRRGPKVGGLRQTIDAFLTEFSGLHKLADLGVICLNILANGARFIDNLGDGRYQDYGMRCLKGSIPKGKADIVFK